MLEKRKVFVQGVKKVGPFPNKETGEIIEGYNVFYVDTKMQNEENLGYLPSRKFVAVAEGKKIIDQGIGYYDLLLDVDFSGNRPKLDVTGFEFIENYYPFSE